MRKIILLFSLTILFGGIQAQPNFPENGPLYDGHRISRIDISLDPDSLEWLYEHDNLESDIEFSARFIFDNGDIRDTIDPVGFRLRGNTSRYSQKKSFKVSFNRFTSGGKYYGVEKLNLNGEHNDPSIMRAMVSWDIMRKWDIPAPRSSHVQVYINDTYYGLYLNVEHIDEEFVKTRFYKNDGNLYKCLYPADLDYLSDNPDAYKLMAGSRRVYELKTNKEADDYTDLAEFINILNNSSDDELVCELDEVFNTYDYLKVVAADILLGNWDGPIYNKNNFYLYHNLSSGKFEYIPYDLDNTCGIDWFGIDWTKRNMYHWGHSNEPRPIYTRLMDNPELRNQYSYFMKKLIVNTIDIDSLNNALNEKRNMLIPYVSSDYYYTLDYGFGIADFMNSLTGAFGAHVKYGLSTYFTERKASMVSQVENEEINPVIKYIRHHRNSSIEIQMTAHIDPQNGPGMVELSYSYDGSNWLSKEMYDDGLHNDGSAADHTYGVLISDSRIEDGLYYQIWAEDAHGNTSLMPCEAVTVAGSSASTALFINEFMASNETTIADEHGNYGDWIEVYNGTSASVWLGDLFLTDNLGSPNKWNMPDYNLEAGGFVLFWADGNPENGDFHTNFKLSKGGEEIGIFDGNQASIDEVIFGEQSEDISFGRISDGHASWQFFETPTPGSSNAPDAIMDISDVASFMLYPNPAHSGMVHLSRNMSFRVVNIYGQEVDKQINSNKIDINGYGQGLYIIISETGAKQKLLVN